MSAIDVIRAHAIVMNDVSRCHSGVCAEMGTYLQCVGSTAAVTLAVQKLTLLVKHSVVSFVSNLDIPFGTEQPLQMSFMCF